MDTSSNKAPQQGNNTLAILSLVFSFIFAPAGLILGIIALKKNQSKGMAITSIVYSGIVSFGLFIMFLAAIFSPSSTQTNTANTNTTITKPTQSELDSKDAEEAKKQAERDAEIKRIADQKAAQEAERIKPYKYKWLEEEIGNSYWILIDDFNYSDPSFKDKIKATILDFNEKVIFRTNTIVSVTDSPTVFSYYEQDSSNWNNYIDSIGGKEVFGAEASLRNIALYHHNFLYDKYAKPCTNQCNELVFYPDAAQDSDVFQFKETSFWKP